MKLIAYQIHQTTMINVLAVLYIPMMAKNDAVIRKAYKTLKSAATVIWKFALVMKQMSI